MSKISYRKTATIFISGLSLIFTSICLFAATSTYAFAGAAEFKAELLRPGGWIAEWQGSSSGELEFTFEDRGDKTVVKINNPAWNQSCERDVTIDSDGVKFDGCNYPGIKLHYDPDDKAYPFKGESDTAYYKLREK